MGDGAQKSPAGAGLYLFTLSLQERAGVMASARTLLAIQRRPLANGDTLRRDGFRHVADQVDMQQTVGKRCAGHFHMVCQGKAQAERLIN